MLCSSLLSLELFVLSIMYAIHCISAHALFASLQLDWAIATGRLLGPTTCLPHKDRGILLSILPKDDK